MSYKDIIPQLGLPDDLNKKLEELLSMEKDKQKKGEGTYDQRFKDLNKARKQFRKSYRKIREHSPSKTANKKNASDSDDDLNISLSSSESDSSGGVDITDANDDMMKRLPGVLTDEQKRGLKVENDQLKYLESKYLQKKLQLEKALKELEEDDKIDADLLKSITEGDNEMDDCDFEAENEELDRIINELKEMTKDPPRESGKLEELAN